MLTKKLRHNMTMITILTLWFFSFSCGVEVEGILVSEIGTCRDVDERLNIPIDITNEFSVNDELVILYFNLHTEIDVRFQYNWYYEDELIYSHLASQNNENGYNFAWLGAREGEILPV